MGSFCSERARRGRQEATEDMLAQAWARTRNTYSFNKERAGGKGKLE